MDRRAQIMREKYDTVIRVIESSKNTSAEGKIYLRRAMDAINYTDAFYNFINCKIGLLCNKIQNRKILVQAMVKSLLQDENSINHFKSKLAQSSYNSLEEYAKGVAEFLLDQISTGGKSLVNLSGQQTEASSILKNNQAQEKELIELKKKLRDSSCKTLTASELNLKFNNNRVKAEEYIAEFNRNCSSFWRNPTGAGNPFDEFQGGSYSSKKRAQRPSPKFPAKSKKHQIIEGNKKGQFYESRPDKNEVFRWYKVKM